MKTINKSTVLKNIPFDILDLLEVGKGGVELKDEASKHIDMVAGFNGEQLRDFTFGGWDRFRNPANCMDWLDGILAGNAMSLKSREEFISLVYLNVSTELAKRYGEYKKLLDDKTTNDDLRAKCFTEFCELNGIVQSLLEKVALGGLRVMSSSSVAGDILRLRKLQNEIGETYDPAKRVQSTVKPGDKAPGNRRTHEGGTKVSSEAPVDENSIDPNFIKFIRDIIGLSGLTISGSKPQGIHTNGESGVRIDSIDTGISLATYSNYRFTDSSGDTMCSVTFREMLFIKDIVMRWLEKEGISTKGKPADMIRAFQALPKEKYETLNTQISEFLQNRGNHQDDGPRSDRLDCDLLNITRLVCGSELLENRHDMSTKFGPRAQARFAFEIVHNHETMYSYSDSLSNYGADVSRSNIDSSVSRVARAVQPIYYTVYCKAISGKVLSTDATTKCYFANVIYGEKTDNGKERQRKQMKIQQLNGRSDDGNLTFYLPLHTSNQELLSVLLNNAGSRTVYQQADKGPENVRTATDVAARGRKFQEDFAEFLKENRSDAALLKEMNELSKELEVLNIKDIAKNPLRLVPCAAHAMTHLLKLQAMLEGFLSDAMMKQKGFAMENYLGSRQLDFIRAVTGKLTDIYATYAEICTEEGDSLEARQALRPLFDDLISFISAKMESAEYQTFFSQVRTQTEYVYDTMTRLKDPFLECMLVKLDQNDTERNMKPLLLIYGRCFHSGSFAGAIETCILLSLLETAENRGLHPLKYLDLAYFGSLYLAGDIPSDEYLNLVESAGIPLFDEKWIGSADLPTSFDDLAPTSEFVRKRTPKDEFVALNAENIRKILKERKKDKQD